MAVWCSLNNNNNISQEMAEEYLTPADPEMQFPVNGHS